MWLNMNHDKYLNNQNYSFLRKNQSIHYKQSNSFLCIQSYKIQYKLYSKLYYSLNNKYWYKQYHNWIYIQFHKQKYKLCDNSLNKQNHNHQNKLHHNYWNSQIDKKSRILCHIQKYSYFHKLIDIHSHKIHSSQCLQNNYLHKNCSTKLRSRNQRKHQNKHQNNYQYILQNILQYNYQCKHQYSYYYILLCKFLSNYFRMKQYKLYCMYQNNCHNNLYYNYFHIHFQFLRLQQYDKFLHIVQSMHLDMKKQQQLKILLLKY